MDDKKKKNLISGTDDFFDELDVNSGYDDDFSGEGPELDDLDTAGRGRNNAAPVDFDEIDTVPKKTSGRKTRELNTAGTAVDPRRIKAETAKSKRKKIRKIIGWTILEIVTLCCIFAYGYVVRSVRQMNWADVNEEMVENYNITKEKKEEMERGYWTFAVFGVDGRSASDLVSRGLNSDVIMIVNINQDTGEIKLCSVFRDTYLNISDDDTYRKINAAYANGGPEQALAALNKNLDLNIKNYVTFNWKAVADGINILGGIDNIDISKAELYYINAFITETVNVTGIGSTQLTSTGPQHLDGVQAVAYGRLRLMDTDFARTERQKRVVKAAFEKAKNSSFSVLNNIMVVCFPEVATNINFNDVVAMAQNISKYHLGETGGFPWQRSSSAIAKVGDVVVPATLESNVRYLHKFLFNDENYEPSAAVLRYSAEISERTGVYKEGQVVESVRTDGGLISTPKTSAAAEDGKDGENGEEEGETDENGEQESLTIGIDGDGHYIYPTDENGYNIIPRDSHGNPIYPTDEDGNIILELDEEGNPIPLDNEYETPGESTHADDFNEADGPGAGGGGPAHNENADGPGSGTTAATTEAYGPGNPAPTESSTAHPGQTVNSSGGPGGGTGGNTPSSGPVIGTGGTGGITPGGTDGPGGGTGGSTGPGGSSPSAGGPGT